jgi:hypothetical protein
MGFRSLGGTFWDAWKDGAIEEVVIDWTRNNGTNSGGINNLSS